MNNYFTTDQPIVAFSKDKEKAIKFPNYTTESGIVSLDIKNSKSNHRFNKLGAYSSVMKPKYLKSNKPCTSTQVKSPRNSVMNILGYKRGSVPGIIQPLNIKNRVNTV